MQCSILITGHQGVKGEAGSCSVARSPRARGAGARSSRPAAVWQPALVTPAPLAPARGRQAYRQEHGCHSRARPGPPRSLGQHLATRLTQLGVERFFGVPGDYNLQVRSGWTPWSVRGPSRRRSPPRTGAHRPARAANRAAACISAIRRAAAGICSNSLIAHLAAAGRALLPLCRSPLARFHTTPPCLRLAPNNPPALSC